MRKIYVFCVQNLIQKFESSNLVMFAHNALSCIKDHWLPDKLPVYTTAPRSVLVDRESDQNPKCTETATKMRNLFCYNLEYIGLF